MIEERHQEPTTPPISKTTVGDNISLLKYLSDVKLKINKIVTEDYVLTKLNPKDKVFVIEMINNCAFVTSLMEVLKQKTKTKQEADTIQAYKEELYNAYMTRIDMIAVVNRNVPNNHILQMLSGSAQEDQEEEETEKAKSLLQTIKEKTQKARTKMRKQKEENGDDD